MIRLRHHPGRRRVLPALALALALACVPPVVVSSPTVDDVVAALRAGDNDRARTLLDELRTQGLGGLYDVRFLQGVLYLRTGKGEEASRVFDELEASEGPAPELASGRALSAWAEGRPAEARTRLEHATRLWPEDPGVWANLGDVYRALSARAYQRVRVLRRSAGAETSSPTAPALSAQPGALPPSGAPSPALSVVPLESAGPASPTTAAESAATAGAVAPAEAAPAQSAAPAGAAGTIEARGDSAVPDGSTPSSGPSSGPTASSPPPPSPEAPAGSAACFLAGPWPDTPPDEVLEWIRMRDARVLSYQSRSSHYRVYLGPFEDRKRAVQTMVSLKKDMGVGDVAWVPAGPLRGTVSLGVYLKQESVDRRLRALHALGLDPKVQPPRAGSWLLGSTSDLEALLTQWPGSFPDVPLAPERCPP